MSTAKKNDTTDMNRDPITGTPGSHPVGTGLGSAGGATVGAVAGAVFGPVGMLVGGAVGAIAGAAVGHNAAERVDPTGEAEYWKNEYTTRPYAKTGASYESDYQPAYVYGVNSRNTVGQRRWDDTLETELQKDWDKNKSSSSLAWNDAKPAVRDAWDRTDRTYSAYNASDRYFESRFQEAPYKQQGDKFDDYRSAYRYGTYARSNNTGRDWDDKLESELGQGWERAKGTSKLTWDRAKSATKDAWHSVERALPGDADNDGR
jgi:hypothetical protein